jgi:hypothetical protein
VYAATDDGEKPEARRDQLRIGVSELGGGYIGCLGIA